MELRTLRYFATVVESGSFTAAAAQLHMAQPSLSLAVSKLETDLGVPLLLRTGRGVEPTSAGRYLLEASSRLLSEADEISATLRRFGSGTAGTLSMAAVPALMWHRIPTLLRAYAAEAPEVELRVVDPPPWEAMDLLAQRKVDLAAVMVADPKRFAQRLRGSFDILDWGEVPIVAALPPDALGVPETVPIDYFSGKTLLLPRRTAAVPSLPEAVEEALRRNGVAPATVRTVETIQTSIPLIEAGLACALLPDPDRASLGRFDLQVRPVSPEPKPLRAFVLVRSGEAADPTIGRLLKRIAAWKVESWGGESSRPAHVVLRASARS